jgi:hypothetical protein
MQKPMIIKILTETHLLIHSLQFLYTSLVQSLNHNSMFFLTLSIDKEEFISGTSKRHNSL